eukprot:2610638-Amphidinium_carterae.1
MGGLGSNLSECTPGKLLSGAVKAIGCSSRHCAIAQCLSWAPRFVAQYCFTQNFYNSNNFKDGNCN